MRDQVIRALLAMAPALVASCDVDGHSVLIDAGAIDASPPDASLQCPEPRARLSETHVGAVVGVQRVVTLELSRDACEPFSVDLRSSDPSVARVRGAVAIDIGQSRADVVIEAVGLGEARIEAARLDDLPVSVIPRGLPSCDDQAQARIGPGDRLSLPSGLAAGASLFIPEGAAEPGVFHVAPFEAHVRCAEQALPEGMLPLGPAVEIAPAHLRWQREVELTLPMKSALLPQGAHLGHVEAVYSGPGVASPRVVSVVVRAFSGSPTAGWLTVAVPRLGTYRAVVRSDAGTARPRRFVYRGLFGFSMGGGAAAALGFAHPELFDFVAPLGGPSDWVYLLDAIQRQVLGGFCTNAERREAPEGCALGANDGRIAPSVDRFEHRQDFEHLHFEDAYGGQGGTFGRRDYVTILYDLARAYGSFTTRRAAAPSDPNITPPGVPDSWRLQSPESACDQPVRVPPCRARTGGPCEAGTGLVDDEYNPEGRYPAITFCDGADAVDAAGAPDRGVWDPDGRNTTRVSTLIAIDINDNGRRDPGEPIVRNVQERFRDCGLDGVCSGREPGFDPVTNPDPSGDDYDFQYNPAGTEGNRMRDGDPCEQNGAEPYDDWGLDGVVGTRALEDGGFDFGEGNGCFDQAPGAVRMHRSSPRHLVRRLDSENLRDLDVFADGGIRDLFNFLVATHHFSGSLAALGLPVRLYPSHAALGLGASIVEGGRFLPERVRWDRVGKYVVVRYGDVDASESEKIAGDGQHVGTPGQLLARLLSTLYWMSDRWPGGDRTRVSDAPCVPNDGSACASPLTLVRRIRSERTGESLPVTIILPPGYYDERHEELRYPVVYGLHGYGMQAADLESFALILHGLMSGVSSAPSADRLQKFIFVVPDGSCTPSECAKGTFFADAPASSPGGPRRETFLLDLVGYVDAHFRTRTEELREVTP